MEPYEGREPLGSAAGQDASSQPLRLNAARAAEHIGERATVCGAIIGSEYRGSDPGSPTYITLEALGDGDIAEPVTLSTFKIAICGEDRAAFAEPPEATYQTGYACVTGTVAELLNEGPGAVVTAPEGIEKLLRETPIYVGDLLQRRSPYVPQEYPLAARRAGIQGTVGIEAVVDPDGSVVVASLASDTLGCSWRASEEAPSGGDSSAVSTACGELIRSAMNTVSRWEFRLRGLAIPAVITPTLTFEIPGRSSERQPSGQRSIAPSEPPRAPCPAGQ